MTLRTTLALTLSCLPLHAQLGDTVPDDQSPLSEVDTLPAFKVLPVGSTLTDITIPRYTPELKPQSALVAKTLIVRSKEQLEGLHLDIYLYGESSSPEGEDGKDAKEGMSTRAHAHLDRATYYQQSGLIHATEPLTAHGDQLALTAQGAALFWEQQTGFLLGHTHTQFHLQDSPKSSADHPEQATTPEPQSPTTTMKPITTAALALSVATFPTLQAADLSQIEARTTSSAAYLQERDQTNQDHIEHSLSSAAHVDQRMQAFKATVAPEVFTIQADPQDTPELEAPAKPGTIISVSSEKGMYFNAQEGHIVYLQNIEAKHPQYTLNCDDQLKVILVKTPNTNADNGDSDQTDQRDLGERFKDIDKAIATGNVVIRGKDSKGQPITARAATAIYTHADGSLVLKGGKPLIVQGNNIAKMTTNDGYIIIHGDMSVELVGPNEVRANIEEARRNR